MPTACCRARCSSRPSPPGTCTPATTRSRTPVSSRLRSICGSAMSPTASGAASCPIATPSSARSRTTSSTSSTSARTARCSRPTAPISSRSSRSSTLPPAVRGKDQPEELDRPARRVHPRHHRRELSLRRDRRRLPRPRSISRWCRCRSPFGFAQGLSLNQLRLSVGPGIALRRRPASRVHAEQPLLFREATPGARRRLRHRRRPVPQPRPPRRRRRARSATAPASTRRCSRWAQVGALRPGPVLGAGVREDGRPDRAARRSGSTCCCPTRRWGCRPSWRRR